MSEDRMERAKQNDRRLDEAWNGKNRSSMVMGWVGAEMKRDNQFQDLGYEDQHVYRKSKGYGRSTWFKMLRIAEAFVYANEDEFLRMKVENADALSYVEAEHRYDADLFEKAATQSEEDFKDSLAEFGAAQAGKAKTEAVVQLNFHLKKTQRMAIHEGLQVWMREHQIKDEGEALELLVAEYTGRLTLVGFQKETINRLRMSAEHCADVEVRAELLGLVYDMETALEMIKGKPQTENLKPELVAA